MTGYTGLRSADIYWTAGANGGSPLTAQRVYVYTSGGAYVGDVAVSGGVTSSQITGLTSGRYYRFAVRATNAYGTSPQSVGSAAVWVR